MTAFSTVLGYPLLGASSAVVGRALQHMWPTPLEKAQLQSIHDNLALAYERLASEERRAAQDHALRRETLNAQLQAAEKGQIDMVEMREWPLETTAGSIVRFSQRQAGSALTVILKRSYVSMEDHKSAPVQALLTAFEGAVGRMGDVIRSYFDGDVLFYKETCISPGRKTTLTGQQLVSTIYSLTHTEPVALVEAIVEGPNTIAFQVACWGWAKDADAPELGARSKISVTVADDRAEAEQQLRDAMLTVVTLLSDQFQTLRHMARPKPLRTFEVMKRLATLQFTGLGERADNLVVQSARDLLVAGLSQTIQAIDAVAPPFAVEAGARAALDALASGDQTRAEHELNGAITSYRNSLKKPPSSEKKLMQRLLSPPAEGEAPLVQQAVQMIRGLDFTDFPQSTSELSTEEVLARLDQFDVKLSDEQRKRMRHKLAEMFSYQPKIGVFGKCGAGKSSLCNALFGQDVCVVSDVEACTRAPQEVLLEIGQNKSLVLVDAPGVGEIQKRDEEYAELYRNLLPKLDAVLWVLKADDRAHTTDYDFYNRVVLPNLSPETPFIAVITQADKMEPFREWECEARKPGPRQLRNLETKTNVVAEMFGIKPGQIAVVSAEERYGLSTLVDKLILYLPEKKRFSVLREAKTEHRTVAATTAVKEAISNTVKGAMVVGGAIGGGAGLLIGGPVGMAIGAAVGAAVGRLFGKFFG